MIDDVVVQRPVNILSAILFIQRICIAYSRVKLVNYAAVSRYSKSQGSTRNQSAVVVETNQMATLPWITLAAAAPLVASCLQRSTMPRLKIVELLSLMTSGENVIH